MPAQIGYFDTLKSVAGKVFSYLASITLTGVDGKTLTVNKNITLTAPDDTAVATLPAGANSLAPLGGAALTTSTINGLRIAQNSTNTLVNGGTLTATLTSAMGGNKNALVVVGGVNAGPTTYAAIYVCIGYSQTFIAIAALPADLVLSTNGTVFTLTNSSGATTSYVSLAVYV